MTVILSPSVWAARSALPFQMGLLTTSGICCAAGRHKVGLFTTLMTQISDG
jgi:hypothetical protein